MSLHRLPIRREVDFGQTCPSGGKWYACGSGSKFVGCCGVDPCETGCAQGNVQPVAFDGSKYGIYPDASCGASSDFYSCAASETKGAKTFWGCCKTGHNPCANNQECPSGFLVPAFMERPDQFNAYVSGAASSTASPTATADPNAGAKEESIKTGTIAGAAVGGVVGLGLVVALLVFILFRHKRKNKQNNSGEDGAGDGPSMSEKHDYRASHHPDAPPMYTSPNPNTYSEYNGGHYYQQVATAPQELPAEISPSAPNPNRMSELPAEAARATELESPMSSPRQATFAPQSSPRKPTGLGFS